MLADWDARLLSPERALRLAGDWPVYASVEYADLGQFGPEHKGRWQANLRCHEDKQSCGVLGAWDNFPAAGFDTLLDGTETTIGDLLSGVVRHLVTAHDLSLSGAPDG